MSKAKPGQGKPQLRVRVEPEQYDYLQAEAVRRDKTVSELARHVLRLGLIRYMKDWNTARAPKR